MKIFHKIGVQVRVLPVSRHPGEAEIYHPEVIIPAPVIAPVVDQASMRSLSPVLLW
ncbi:MAG: hypothetical protein U0930_15285 [Pirellulales bacterium]